MFPSALFFGAERDLILFQPRAFRHSAKRREMEVMRMRKDMIREDGDLLADVCRRKGKSRISGVEGTGPLQFYTKLDYGA